MRKPLVLTLALAFGVLLAGCRCDICCSTRVPPDPCAPCAPPCAVPSGAPAAAPSAPAPTAR